MSKISPRVDFGGYTRNIPPTIPFAIQRATGRFLGNRAARVAEMPQWEELRQAAHDLRLWGIEHLDELIAQVERKVTEAGGRVHHARTAEDACAIVTDLARQRGVKTVVKAKSMATEEIGLNHALEARGVRAVETDLGEYIIQLAGVGPSHIIGPAIHLTKEEIARLFTEKLGVEAIPDPTRLTAIARQILREEFLGAGMGISGANFVVAETGTVVVVTNEGNGRMCTTLPDIHVAVAGIDKIIPDWDSLTVLLKLLARSATGQKFSTYTSLITGPRRAEGEYGAREFHLILLDNGRSRIRQDHAARESLLCVRCGACLNICPVYNQVGGYAYGWVYSGPIGAILSPQLLGTKIARGLPYASSLCGACADICPVKIPIPQILLHLRHRVVEGDAIERASAPFSARLAARLGAIGLGSPLLYKLGAATLRALQAPFRRDGFLPALPPPLNRWTKVRPFPAFDGTFRAWWGKRNADCGLRIADSKPPIPKSEIRNPKSAARPAILPPRAPAASSAEIDRLLAEINALSGVARRVSKNDIAGALNELVEKEEIKKATLWATPDLAQWKIVEQLRARGVEIIPHTADKHAMAQADLGITGADFALPETGTLGLLSSPDQPRAVSLLPRVHLAIMRAAALRADLHQVFEVAKKHGYLIFITGPSRTADIELTLTLGVHGPRALYVWVVE